MQIAAGELIALLSLAIAFVGALYARDRYVMGQIQKAVSQSSEHAATLHGRIDDVKDKFVRRDDLAAHLARIDSNVADLKTEFRGVTQKLDAIADSVRTHQRSSGQDH